MANTNKGFSTAIDLRGQKFGKLTPIYHTGKRTHSRYAIWMCECECGNHREVSSQKLKRGRTLSCGECERGTQSYLAFKLKEHAKENWGAQFEYPIEIEGKRLFLDIYIPGIMVIEVNGLQHYHFTEHFHGDGEGFRQQNINDFLKFIWAGREGVMFLSIPQDKYRNRLQEIISFVEGNMYP